MSDEAPKVSLSERIAEKTGINLPVWCWVLLGVIGAVEAYSLFDGRPGDMLVDGYKTYFLNRD